MKAWLIGPLEQAPLDVALQRSRLPFEPIFFTAADRLRPLAPRAEGVLLLEPLERLLPEDIWQLDLPLIGLSSRPSQPPALARRLFELLDGVIALEPGLADSLPEGLPEGLPLSPVTVWNLGPQHRRDAEAPALFRRGYLLPQSWSPHLPLYETSGVRPDYFIQIHPGRLPFYLQRCKLALTDARLNAQYFQALACGACLLVHTEAPAAAELEKVLMPGRDFLYFDQANLPALLEQLEGDPTARLRPAPELLDSLRLEQTLPQALAALGPLPIRRRGDALHETLQLVGITHPAALLRLQAALPGLPPGEEKIWLELSFFQKLLQSPYSQSDPRQLQSSVAVRLAQLPAGPDKTLLQAMASLDQQDFAGALHALPAEAPNFAELEAPAAWQQAPLLQEVLSLHAGQPGFAAWLGYQRALCLAQLQRFEAAIATIEPILETSYFPLASAFWQAVRDRPPAASCRRWLDRHPQNLELARGWLEALGREGQTELAQGACQAYQDLCRRYLIRSNELEKFLQLARRLKGSAQAEPGTLHLLWEGPLHSHSSLASINRRWMLALAQAPRIHLTHIPYEPPDLPPGPETEMLNQSWPEPVDVYVSHRWPPRDAPPVEGKWASIIPWEFGVIPQSWVQRINAQLDRVWVPSRFVAHSFEISGVDPARLAVIPNGVDTELLKPDGPIYPLPTSKSCRFLFVGGMLERKGIDLLLAAFGQAFGREDDVALVIKSFGSGGHYALHPFHRQLDELRRRQDGPEILFIEDDLDAEELAALYRACQVYVHPYRGEGFGMPILEAMACGLPVIVPNAGPAPEFCPPAASWQVPTRIQFAASRDVEGLGPAIGRPYYTVVDIAELAATLRAASADPPARRAKGQAAAAAAGNYSWERIFAQVLAEVEQLARQRTPRAQREQARQQHLQDLLAGRLSLNQLEALLPEDPLLLEPLLTQLPPAAHRAAWERALAAGLPVSEILRLARALPGFWKGFPLRLYWPARTPLPLARPQGNDKLAVLQEPVHVDFALGIEAGAGMRWLIDRRLPADLDLQQPICYSDKAQLPELLAAGADQARLRYLPLAVDFGAYSPHIAPLVLEESLDRFVFLSIFDWESDGGWQDLLRAYFATFGEDEAVNLVFKPLGADFESMVEKLMTWMEAEGYDPDQVPSLTFVQEELSPEQLPGLYRGADVFVAAHSNSGIWHLAAQASGVPVIGCGHFGFLQRPFCEIFAPGDLAQLGWLLRQHKDKPQPERGECVREFLRPDHDRISWQEGLENMLIRSYFSA